VSTVLLYSITCINWNIKEQNNRTLWIPNIYFEYLQKKKKNRKIIKNSCLFSTNQLAAWDFMLRQV
jgi:hypothetical protein